MRIGINSMIIIISLEVELDLIKALLVACYNH